jgi:arylsulfatase A-like enzyme
MKAARQGNWKYVRDGEIHLLFNLQSDPRERYVLSYQHQSRVRALQQALDEWEKHKPLTRQLRKTL